MRDYARPLNNKKLIEQFFQKVLGIRPNSELFKYTGRVLTAELTLQQIDEKVATQNSKDFRDGSFRDDESRLLLCERIVSECMEMNILPSDEEITLGKGGCAPGTTVQQNGQAFILIGPPASGKSYLAKQIAYHHGAFILDSDFAKRKLPEYKDTVFGASIVHSESNQIVFGHKSKSGYKSVLEYASEFNLNLVIPKIGSNLKGVIKLTEILKTHQYKVHLTLIHLDREKATIRALKRFIKTNRYVPLGYIFDTCGNNPFITYIFLKINCGEMFESFGMLNSDVEEGESPILIEAEYLNPATIYKNNDEN